MALNDKRHQLVTQCASVWTILLIEIVLSFMQIHEPLFFQEVTVSPALKMLHDLIPTAQACTQLCDDNKADIHGQNPTSIR